MHGYGDDSYGDAFADVYDDWYADVSDVAATVTAVGRLAAQAHPPSAAGDRPATVLELGVGTGRLAIPLAAAGMAVVGVDSSPAMLERLRAKCAAQPSGVPAVAGHLGDMVDGLPAGPFDVILVAYNTLFNLRSAERQQACFMAAAQRLAPAGALVIEAFVPDPHAGSSVTVRSMTADVVVLSASTHRPGSQTAEGQYIELSESGGVRLRPWSIRYSSPAELDAFAAAAGLVLAARWSDFDESPFTDDSDRHVSVYRPA